MVDQSGARTEMRSLTRLIAARKTSIRWESRNFETPAMRKDTRDRVIDRKQLTQTTTTTSGFDKRFRDAMGDGGMEELR
jgi:hypothetical protein